MIESILFGLAYFATWPAILVFCILGVWCEHGESRGWTVFWALVAGASAFFYFDMPLERIAIWSVAYVMFGVVWSFYRYKRFIVAKVEKLSKSNLHCDRVEQYHPTKMLDTITAWILIWPLSLVENLCSDVINGIETLVKKVFKGVYNRIYNAAVADMVSKKGK